MWGTMALIDDKRAELVKINTAIDIILTGGQDTRIDDTQVEMWVKRADLATLYARQGQLEAYIDRYDRPGGYYAS